MDSSIYLAHGALGYWDELIFAGVAVIFLVMMGISWMRSLNEQPDDLDMPSASDPTTNEESIPEGQADRFRLD